MCKKPILSFVIPTFNRAETVFKCVNHILAYEDDDIEVVVSDNNSDDNTIELLKTIPDKRLRIYKNEFNMITIGWPIAVSRASGQWAALMSDEDIVQLDNIPYFLEMLSEAKKNDIVGVIYSFPPLCKRSSAKCENILESIILSVYYSGHITGHIVNMDYFELMEPQYYLGCQTPTWWEVYQRFGPPTDEKYYISNPPVTEPQQEIFLSAAKKGLIKVEELPLCIQGEDLVLKRPKIKNFDPITAGGRSLSRYHVIARARLHKVLDVIIENSKNENITEYIDFSLFTMLLDNISITALFAVAMMAGTDFYRPEHLMLAKNHFNYTVKDVINFIMETAKEVNELVKPHCNRHSEAYFDFAVAQLAKVLNGDMISVLPKDIPLLWRIKIGDFLFQLSLRSRTTITQKYDENGIVTGRKSELLSDGIDSLKFGQTFEMMKLLREEHDYDAVIHFNEVESFRAKYIRGEAYFKLGDFEHAKQELETFLEIFENATVVSNIITGMPSIYNSYYFLGYIYHILGKEKTSLGYYAKCYNLCERFLIKNVLNSIDSLLPRMRVLITGANSFIAKHIFFKNFDVTVTRREKLDLLDSGAVKSFLLRQRFDAVIHLANPTGANPLDKPEELFERSMRVFNNLASCSDYYGKMIYIGSGAEYGKQRDIAEISEDDFGKEIPQDAYGLSRYIMSEITKGKSNIINLRLFGCCGENDPEYKLIPYIAKCIKENRPITLRENKRFDYLYADDITTVLEYLISHDTKHKSYNLCSGESIMISEIADEVKKHMKSDLPVVFERDALGLEYTGSNARLRAEIPNWKPTKIRNAIEKIILKEFL